MNANVVTHLHLDDPSMRERIAAFGRRWQVRELALFGSALRDDFRSDSDVDVLVTFAASAPWSLFDVARMERELSGIFGRAADVLEKAALRNPFRRQRILSEQQVIYVDDANTTIAG